jgi:hypothetical protein
MLSGFEISPDHFLYLGPVRGRYAFQIRVQSASCSCFVLNSQWFEKMEDGLHGRNNQYKLILSSQTDLSLSLAQLSPSLYFIYWIYFTLYYMYNKRMQDVKIFAGIASTPREPSKKTLLEIPFLLALKCWMHHNVTLLLGPAGTLSC